MKNVPQENLKESICFTPACWIHENQIVVYAHEVNVVDYTTPSVKGAGLRDEEITISFANMIHQIINAQETETFFPLSYNTTT